MTGLLEKGKYFDTSYVGSHTASPYLAEEIRDPCPI
jgi:hypothetical protein